MENKRFSKLTPTTRLKQPVKKTKRETSHDQGEVQPEQRARAQDSKRAMMKIMTGKISKKTRNAEKKMNKKPKRAGRHQRQMVAPALNLKEKNMSAAKAVKTCAVPDPRNTDRIIGICNYDYFIVRQVTRINVTYQH